MERLRGRKPSPAMVVSIIALVFALAGTSIAGVATISVLNKKEKKQTRNIAKDEINKAAPGLSVAKAVNAQNAQTATGAQTAQSAELLDGLDSTAFARVVADDTRNIDPPNVASGVCNVQTLTGGPFAGVQPGDVALVFPRGQLALVLEGFLQSTAGQAQFALCNFSIVSVNPAALDFRVIVLR